MVQRLHDLIGPVVADLGYELWHLEHVGPSADRILRVYIDAPEGVSVEDCEKVSSEVDAVLDVAQAQRNGVVDHSYLEVSSPGLDRPLATVEHFQRFVGGKARVKLFAPVDGQRNLCGVIRSASDGTVELEVDDKIFSLEISDMAKARLEPDV